MASEVAFTDPCPCGSGEKYKDCCGRDAAVLAAQTRNKIIAGLALVVSVAAIFMYVYRSEMETLTAAEIPSDAVYVEECRHYHNAEGVELHLKGKVWDMDGQRFVDAPELPEGLIPPPGGPEEEGQVWSPEHGHWHKAPEGQFPQPLGLAPDEQFWSPEHGHWHDIP